MYRVIQHNRFHVIGRLKRGEFLYAIVDNSGREVATVVDEKAARQIVGIMNGNELTPTKVTEVEVNSTSGRVWWEHLRKVLTARRNRVLR